MSLQAGSIGISLRVRYSLPIRPRYVLDLPLLLGKVVAMPTDLPTPSPVRISETVRVVQPFAWYFAVGFALLSLCLRFAPMPENFATFGALAFFSGLFLTGAMRWAFPLLVLFIADCIGHFLHLPGMGFYDLNAMVFNYAAFAVFSGTGAATRHLWNRNELTNRSTFSTLPLAIVSGSFLFFIVSNFGAWLDPRMGYDKSLSGLKQCYLMGLPFWRSSLASDLFFGVGFVAIAWAVSSLLASRTKAIA